MVAGYYVSTFQDRRACTTLHHHSYLVSDEGMLWYYGPQIGTDASAYPSSALYCEWMSFPRADAKPWICSSTLRSKAHAGTQGFNNLRANLPRHAEKRAPNQHWDQYLPCNPTSDGLITLPSKLCQSHQCLLKTVEPHRGE